MKHASNHTTNLTRESLAAAALAIPEGEPFVMLNLLRYKEHAEYRDGPGLGPCTGREAYHRGYVATFTKLAEGIPIQIEWLGAVLAGLVTPAGERWDELVLVRYPDYATFRRIVESDRYEAEAAPHRRASLDDWRLLATTKLG